MVANCNLNLKDGWRFHRGDISRVPESNHDATYLSNMAGYALSLYDIHVETERWNEVILPHDWLTEEALNPDSAVAGGYKKRETGWYYLSFKLPENEIEVARLVFEGVLGHTVVYVNGTVACRNFSGYNRFSCDISDYLLAGEENVIALYIDARNREGWWYEGAGLYRPVYIEFRRNQHIHTQDYFVRSERNEDIWNIRSTLKIEGLEAQMDDCVINTRVYDAEGKVVSQTTTVAKEKTDILNAIDVPNLWSPEEPYLYTVECQLSIGSEIYDTISQRIGLREIEWFADEGMYLNGSRYQIKGICCHQDHCGVGAATTRDIIEYRIKILKDMGANAYRCAHHAPSEELLRVCDEMGMLVMAENRNFAVSTDVLSQLESLIRHARNHTCVFVYSLFNEERWQGEERGSRIMDKMRKHALRFDTTRAITGAQSFGALNEKNASDSMDIIGANYNTDSFDEIHRRYPDAPILGTENCPTYATRGVYATNMEEHVYGNYGEEWGSWSDSIEKTFEIVAARPFVAGFFPWSGFDYRGEPQPHSWPSVSSHWGFTDLCGFQKDIAYLLTAYYKDELMVHLFPHWNWEEGQEVRVCVYTNADIAELYLNGRTLGEKKIEKKRAEWKVNFEAGEIKVVAKREDEQVIDKRHTVGKAYAIVLDDQCNRDAETHIVNVKAVDVTGELVPTFSGEVSFDYPEGANLGIGNGDPNSHVPEKSSTINLFYGRAQIILRGGTGKVTATCAGLVGDEIAL